VASDRTRAEDAALAPGRAKRLRTKLLAWYDLNRRDLPWRRTRDPYAIWISEAMLQQTRVETVIPYWERFLERLPDVQALADAPEEEVYSLWAGLGYYSRARNLHAAARMVVDEFEGAVPDESDDLLRLPGVGRYTAGALASIAFDRPEPIVDGNVARVLSRQLGMRSDVSQPKTSARLWREAAALVEGPRPGDLNQALMELGALVCTPKAPDCKTCPWTRSCDARRMGDAESLPIKKSKPKVKRVRAVAVLLERGARALAVRRESGGLLGGLWELPGAEVAHGEKPLEAAARVVREQLGSEPPGLEEAGRVRHLFTHRDMALHLFRSPAPDGRVRKNGISEHRWVSGPDLFDLPIATLTRKALEALGPGTPNGKPKPIREKRR
jgi:A/G-specific adenine glycosylase